MSQCELTFEVSYELEKFSPVDTLRVLSSFTDLVGGLNVDIVAPVIDNWNNHTDTYEQSKDSIVKIQERLLQSELELRVLFHFPQNQELVSALAKAYGKSTTEVKTYSRDNDVLLGYATVYISLDEKTAVVRVYPDVAELGQIIMKSSAIRSQLVNFCQETGAIEAHWENLTEETVIPIWQLSTAIV
jgi:hypothetical protein